METSDKEDILEIFLNLWIDKNSLEWLEKYIKYINMILSYKPDLDSDTRKKLFEELDISKKKLDKMRFDLFNEKTAKILEK